MRCKFLAMGWFFSVWMWLIDIALLAGGIVSVLLLQPEGDYFIVGIAFSGIFGFLFIGFTLFIILNNEIITISDEGIKKKSIIRGTYFLKWPEVKEIEAIKLWFLNFIYITDFEMKTAGKNYLRADERGLIRLFYNKKAIKIISRFYLKEIPQNTAKIFG